jgi:hypothetical protein
MWVFAAAIDKAIKTAVAQTKEFRNELQIHCLDRWIFARQLKIRSVSK